MGSRPDSPTWPVAESAARATGAARQRAWLGPAIFLAQGALLGLFVLSPFPLALAAAAAFAVLGALAPVTALTWVVLTAPFYRFPKEAAGLALPVSEVAVWLSLAGWLLRQAVRPAGRPRWNPAALRDPWHPIWPVAGFLVAATLSLGASEFLRYSLREYRQVVVEPLIFGGLVFATCRSERDIRVFVRAFLGVGALVAAYSIFHYHVIGVTEATGGVERALAVYHSPNALGLFLGRIAPAAIVVAVFGHDLGRDRLLAGVAAGAIAYALFLTYSRGAWLGVAVALLFVAAWRGRRALLIGLGGLLAAGLALIPFVGWQRLLSATSSGQRLYLWEAAVTMIRDHAWGGVGLDNFRYLYPRYMQAQAWQEPDISHPHNLVLDYWLRLGILGLLSLAWLQISFWRAGAIAWCQSGPAGRVMALALMASMVDFVAHGLLDNSYFLIDLAVIFWLTFALVHSLARLSRPVPGHPATPPGPRRDDSVRAPCSFISRERIP